MYSIEMESVLNPYRCRQCGAASYARLVHRGPDGAMGYADRYRCSGCSLTFTDPAEWRVQDRPHANSTQVRVMREAAPVAARVGKLVARSTTNLSASRSSEPRRS
jgi:DNA-directed RNA polymerase subunit RPC12/RpoP